MASNVLTAAMCNQLNTAMNQRSSFVIHLGYERTSTTMHQKHVFPNHERIRYLGKPFTDQGVRNAFYELTCHDAAHYDEVACRKALLASVRSSGAFSAACNILSDEIMLSPQSVDIDVLIRRLQTVFGDFKVIITIREQFELFRSWCEHVLFKHEYGSLESIIAYQLKFRTRRDSLLSFLDYYQYYSFLCDKLGRDQVLMLPYELLRRHPSTYANLLGNFLGISADLLIERINSAPRENSRRSMSDIAYYDFKKRHLSQRRRRIPDRAGKLLFWLLPINRQRVDRMMRDLQGTVSDEFAASNIRLRKALLDHLKIDIAELGYSLPLKSR
jgi:hypothetical protein